MNSDQIQKLNESISLMTCIQSDLRIISQELQRAFENLLNTNIEGRRYKQEVIKHEISCLDSAEEKLGETILEIEDAMRLPDPTIRLL